MVSLLPTRVMTVLGTRPEIVKCSPLLPLFDDAFEHVLVHTGQHYDASMDDWFFRDLGLRAPDYNLAAGSGSHGAQLARMLSGLEPLIQERDPHIVFVQGDTNSTLAGALAGAKLGVPVVHLEAGCRSFNRAMPEEINRVVIDHLATLCLAPDMAAVKNLTREGIAGDPVRLVGSTGIDACLRVAGLDCAVNAGPDSDYAERGFLVATIHRAENTTPEIFSGLLDALECFARDMPVVFPVHPRTASTLEQIGRRPGITYVDPVSYPLMVAMLGRCRALLTDSGGLQEEAAVLGTPTFILRNETEWIEFVEAGRHRLVGTDPATIIEAMREAENNGDLAGRMRHPLGLERAGAAGRVMEALHELVSGREEEHGWKAATSASPVARHGNALLAAGQAHATGVHR